MNHNLANMISARQKWSGHLMVLFVIALFLLPFAYYTFEPERLQWKTAASIRKYEQGQKSVAIEELTEIVQQSSDPDLRLRLIAWLKDDGQSKKAIGHCDYLIASFPVGGESSIGDRATQQKADCLLVLGEYKLAMKAVESVLELSTDEQKQSIQYRNRLSYYRGLCRQDLGLAIRDMNAVVRDVESGWTKYPISFPGRVAMAAGLVSRITDQRETAAAAISQRLRELADHMDSRQLDLNNKLYNLMHKFVPLDKGLSKQVDLARENIDIYRNEVVVLKSVLALLLDETGNVNHAKQRRNEVARAGYDCSEILESLPTEYALLAELNDGATYLDTRGYVHFVRGEYHQSLRDMDLAILSANVLLESLSTSIQNTTDMIDIPAMQAANEKRLATLLYHRMQILDARTETEGAEVDRKRIIELGFEPGPNLF